MKKILVLLGAIVISSGAAFSADCSSFKCPANPYSDDLSISNVTGTNFLAERIANTIIKKQILRDSQGKYKVNLESYNIAALKKGIFKSLEITGEDTVTDGIYASMIKLRTVCDYNYIEINNKEKTTTFKEDFGMAYAVQFTESDLNKTMANSQYTDLIRKVNSIGNTTKMFNISSTSAKIINNKLVYVMRVAVPLLNLKKDVAIQTDLKVRNGEIIIDEAELMTEAMKVDVNKLLKLVNYLDPLDFSMELMKNKDANMQVKEVNIKDNKINVSGLITVAKDVVTEQ